MTLEYAIRFHKMIGFIDGMGSLKLTRGKREWDAASKHNTICTQIIRKGQMCAHEMDDVRGRSSKKPLS